MALMTNAPSFYKKLTSATLAAFIVVLAPGLAPYQALAANVEGPSGPIRTMPIITNGIGAPSSSIQTPDLSATTQIPGAVIPGANIPAAAVPVAPAAGIEASDPAAPAIQPAAPQAPTTFAAAQNLAGAVDPEAKPAAQQGALETAYTGANAVAAKPTEAVDASESCATTGGCPFAKLFGKSKQNNGGSNNNTPAPARPKPADVGLVHKAAMYAMATTWKVWDRAIGARWDKMPPMLAAVYLYFNEQYLRLHMWDAAANAPSTESKTYGAATEDQKKFRTADGSYMDLKDPGMAAAGTRFNHLRKPDDAPNPNWEKMEPNPYVISQELQQRAHDKDGNPIIKEIPANSWFTQIQPQLHDWFNHEQQPLTDNPVTFTVPKGHPLKPEGGEVVMNRTKTDPTVPADYKGAAIHRNGETSPWDRSDLYGSSQETQDAVRTHQGGHLKLGEDGWLPDDPAKPGVPKTGFNNNVSMTLTMNNVTMAKEHNLVADAVDQEYRAKGIQLSDEELFQKARLRMTGFNARNHTVPWTQWLFAGSKIGQEIMWADWYGFLNKRFKLAYMRWSDRHPSLAKFTDPFIRTELLFGVPGTKATHYGKHYNFTEEFVDVYRMHQLIRDTYKVHHLETNPDGTIEVSIIDNVKLRDMVGANTQQAMRKHSYADWALTMGKENVGELTINNVPDDLRNVTAQDGAKDGHKVDLGAIDIMRTRERLAASTYVRFTMRLGEKPPRTFEELTGGDKEKADKLRAVYKSINDVDFQIGILAERKPIGFALGNRQFKVFVLSAPARLKNDRFLSTDYNAKTYDQSGIEYMETNNWSNLVARHAPELKALEIEAMANPYMTYPEAGWLPKALAEDSAAADKKLAKGLFWGGIAGAAATIAMIASGIIVPMAAAVGFVAALYAGVEGQGMLEKARKNLTAATISSAKKEEARARRGALLVRAGAAASFLSTAALAVALHAAFPWVAAGLGIAGLVAFLKSWKGAGAARDALALEAVEIKARLRAGQVHIDPATLPGESSIAKRYWFLLGDKRTPAASFSDSYQALKKSGLSAPKAFVTAAMSHLMFAAKTQKNMSELDRRMYKPGRFDIYIPNIIDAHGYSNSRVYASREDAKALGLKPGDLNMAEFDRIFRDFGALRGYVTAYDLARMRDMNAWRDKQEGRGNWFTRLMGRLEAKRRAEQLIELFADRVVWEDGQPGGRVPAISREQLLRFYQGSAEAELNREELR